MSYLKTINIQHLTSGTNNIVLDANGNMTCAGTVSAGSSMGMRNRIINGDMRIDQRKAGASVTVTGGSDYYSCDRWEQWQSVNSKYSIQRSTTAPVGFTNSILATSLSTYSVLAADNFAISQQIEGYNVADFAWGSSSAKSATVSFWVYSSLTGTFGGAVSNSAVNRSYPFTYTISTANTWEYKTITIPGDTTGTWLTDNGIGIRLWFSIGAGSNYLGTAGSWASADYRGASGQTSVLGTNGATWYITGVQFEVGSIATPFERRLYGHELALCQRYYEASEFAVATSRATAITPVPFAWNYKVQKRTQPNVTVGYIGGNRVGTGPVTFANTISSAYYGTTKVDGVTWETTGDSTNIGTYNTIWSGIASAEL